jgi:small-conductance mechanosensitive channel
VNDLIEPRHVALFTVAVVGTLLLVAGWVYRSVIDFLPMGRTRREALDRGTPVLGTGAGLLYALYVARTLLEGHEEYLLGVLMLIVGAFVFASWFAIRDVINGMFLKAGRITSIGDHVRIGDVHGRVEHMGLRTMTVETSSGDEAILPYSTIARDSIMRTPSTENTALHTFAVGLPRGLSVVDAKTRIRHAALQNHWTSLVREPDISFGNDEQLEVSVFALDVDHGPAIETAVRAALAKAGDPRDQRPPSGPVARS